MSIPVEQLRAAVQAQDDELVCTVLQSYDMDNLYARSQIECFVVEALEDKGFGAREELFRSEYTFCAGEKSRISWEKRKRVRKISHCTPLAAAIICGSLQAVECLLKQPSI